VTERGERTRERLIAAAEQLWAARGIASVSVREINAAAGQRNNTALHYHFGGREALLGAIARRHLAVLNERSDKVYAEMQALGDRWSVRDQVALLVRPTAEYVGEGPSARAWLRISAQIAGAPGQTTEETAAVVSQAVIDVGTRLVERLAPDLGFALAVDRVRMASEAVLHLLADRARLEDAPDRARPMMQLPVFVELVIDMTTAAMTAPPSDALLGATRPESVQDRGESLHD
jgi:AcrR family transcriptional regulator